MPSRLTLIVAGVALATATAGAGLYFVHEDDPEASAQTFSLTAQSATWTQDLKAGDQYLNLRNDSGSPLRGIMASQTSSSAGTTYVGIDACTVAWTIQSGVCAGEQMPVLIDTALDSWTARISLDTFSDFETEQVRHLRISTRSDADLEGQIAFEFTGTARTGDADDSIATQGTDFGVFAGPEPGQSDWEAVQEFESTTGRQAPVVVSFWSWAYSDFALAKDRLRAVTSSGRAPLVTWEPWTPESTADDFPLASISAGAHDEYITDWAIGLRDLGEQVYLRPMHEMNGNWYPWAGADPKEYIAAWRHIHAIFDDVGASNVQFVYSPNNESVGTSYTISDYYPGSDVVDVLAADGYNCLGGSWRSFSDLFSEAYAELAALDEQAPIWIAETASCESQSGIAGAGGHTQASWITDMMNATGFGRLKVIVWFNTDKEFDWRLTSSSQSLAAYRG